VNGADCILTECANFRDATDVLVVTLDEIWRFLKIVLSLFW
jgi:hypothetical protein